MPIKETEIVIIGGGIVGGSVAYHLAEHGHRVTLLERGEIASEASGVNAGSISARGLGHAPTLDDHLYMGSLNIFKSLQIDQGYDIEFRNSGSLRAIQTEEQYEFTRDRALALRSQGYDVELLTTGEARSIEPEINPGLSGFLFTPLISQADPKKATQAIASAAERSGASILTNHEVTDIKHLGDGMYCVATSQGELRAGTLVIAAGAWCGPVGEMLGLKIPITPVRGQMWASESLPPRVFHNISASESPLQWRGEVPGGSYPPELTHRDGQRLTRHLYGRQNRDGEIIFGGDREMVGLNKQTDSSGIETNKEHASEILPLLRTLSINRTWVGIMPFSMDGSPIIGRIPQMENLYIASGLASSGFGRGPMSGKLLADYIHTGHMPHLLIEADPARCVTAV